MLCDRNRVRGKSKCDFKVCLVCLIYLLQILNLKNGWNRWEKPKVIQWLFFVAIDYYLDIAGKRVSYRSAHPTQCAMLVLSLIVYHLVSIGSNVRLRLVSWYSVNDLCPGQKLWHEKAIHFLCSIAKATVKTNDAFVLNRDAKWNERPFY